MKKILIFYATYGSGHVSAANSLKNHIEQNYPNIEVQAIDCVKYVNRALDKVTTEAYMKMAKNAQWAWEKIYADSQKKPFLSLSANAYKLLAPKLLKLIQELEPDLIISTHFFSSQIVSYLKEKEKISCESAVILTDFEAHEQWVAGSDYIENFFVSNEQMIEFLENHGIQKSKIHNTGIPISDRFLKNYNKEEILKSLNLSLDKKTILFFAGGTFGLGSSHTVEIFKALTNVSDTYQIIAISGKNEKMFDNFTELVTEKNCNSIVVLKFSDKIPELMSVSDLVITKPGGLTVSESLASKLPIVVINPIPGQEEGNAKFLESTGASVWIKKDDDPIKVILNLLNNPVKIEQMKAHAEKIAKPNSSKDICDILIKEKNTIN